MVILWNAAPLIAARFISAMNRLTRLWSANILHRPATIWLLLFSIGTSPPCVGRELAISPRSRNVDALGGKVSSSSSPPSRGGRLSCPKASSTIIPPYPRLAGDNENAQAHGSNCCLAFIC
jgi:hypothetical protein